MRSLIYRKTYGLRLTTHSSRLTGLRAGAAVLVVLGVTADSAAAHDVLAQQQPAPAGGGPLSGLDNATMTPAEIQKLFDAYLVMEAQQALTLNDQQYPQFLTRLRALQDTRRRLQQERNQLMSLLQRLTNPRTAPPVADGQITDRLTALHELEVRTVTEMQKAYRAIDEVLDVRQQARFRLFEEQIERRKIELLTRARQQNRANQPRKNPPPQ